MGGSQKVRLRRDVTVVALVTGITLPVSITLPVPYRGHSRPSDNLGVGKLSSCCRDTLFAKVKGRLRCQGWLSNCSHMLSS